MMEKRKFWRTRELGIEVDYGSDENNSYNHLLNFYISYLRFVSWSVYRSNHHGVKNINVKNWAEEGDKVFVKAR